MARGLCNAVTNLRPLNVGTGVVKNALRRGRIIANVLRCIVPAALCCSLSGDIHCKGRCRPRYALSRIDVVLCCLVLRLMLQPVNCASNIAVIPSILLGCASVHYKEAGMQHSCGCQYNNIL